MTMIDSVTDARILFQFSTSPTMYIDGMTIRNVTCKFINK